MVKIAIIGAGLSGVTFANLLKDYAEVALFEKSRGVSGRMSTRFAQPYYFDHGAQYFTARTRPFQNFIKPLVDEGIVQRWNANWVKIDGKKIIMRKKWVDEEPRYVGVPGMNEVVKYLANGLKVYLNTEIIHLDRHKENWDLKDGKSQVYRGFDWVISTIPSPQVSELLPKFFLFYDDVKTVEMCASFSLMLGFKKKWILDFEAAQITNTDLSWIAVNSHKPGRDNHFTLMVHSDSEYAEKHINDNRKEVMQHLIKETSFVLDHDVQEADYKAIHGWRYANNVNRDRRTVFLDQNHKLAACGDWCLGGRVEGGFTSAYDLANVMIEKNLL